MTPLVSRHARLTSLVGTLLTVAVAACLIAFSLVAQHAALQSPGAPEVDPVVPGGGAGSAIDLGSVAVEQPDGAGEGDGAVPTPSADEEIDALVALADVPADDAASPGPERAVAEPDLPPIRVPRVADEGPDDPDPCTGRRCKPGSRPGKPGSRPASDLAPADASPARTCGKGHVKNETDHRRGRGRGHCEYGDRHVAASGRTTDSPASSPGAAHGRGSGRATRPGGGSHGHPSASAGESAAGSKSRGRARETPSRSGNNGHGTSKRKEADSGSGASSSRGKSSSAKGGEKSNGKSNGKSKKAT